ncbi:MAG: hypothetical protein LBI86_07935 [Treponema sp.]|jgi:hypothetical protein|nr:hypothetical protein [Treponema sp.]
MKNRKTIDSQWYLKRIDPVENFDTGCLDSILEKVSSPRDRLFNVPKMPLEVYEVLIAEKEIENPNIHGDSTDCLWVAESDWIYFTDFTCVPDLRQNYLDFQGIDTYADIYLNGEKIGSHDDVYIPCDFDVTGKLLDSNRLVVHIHSPKKKIDEVKLPKHVHNAVNKFKPGARTRMYGPSFHDYLGPKPYLVRLGIYGEIRLVSVDKAEIQWLHIPYKLSAGYESVNLTVELVLRGDIKKTEAKITIIGPSGEKAASVIFKSTPGSNVISGNLILQDPELWWPRTHGNSPLYTIIAELCSDDALLDKKIGKIGFRNIEKIGDLDFTINGLPLKIWGSNLAPVDSLTNVYDKKKMDELLDLAELANHNCLRVWGENERLDDDFYNECDRRGFLLWHDFFGTFSMYMNDLHLFDLMRQEAEYQVLRLRDHPCIWLWCGGNESLMCVSFEFPGEEMLGIEVFNEIYPAVCSKLDPERYYHCSSPSGGAYPNDPLAGDTHGYTHIWYVPGSYYPVFLSENNRVSAPAKRTMKRMMKSGDLWPEGYDGLLHKNSEFPWPEEWNKYNSNQGYWKLGDIQNYYDATDLDAMLYRLGWAHGDYLRRRVERYRRGIPLENGMGNRITKGHILWKFNNSCNHIFFGVIDYFLEPYIAYYCIKRVYEPVLLGFDIGNFINLWIVNDTTEPLEGSVFVRLFSPEKNCVIKNFTLPFAVAPDQSKFVADLNCFGQFRSNNILHAYAVTNDGRRVAETFDYVDIERHIRFPTDGIITIQIADGDLFLTSSRYERSVEILGFTGKEGKDEFGWLFDDNYFDMIPGQIKRVKVLGKNREGIITVKGYYSDNTAKTEYHCE